MDISWKNCSRQRDKYVKLGSVAGVERAGRRAAGGEVSVETGHLDSWDSGHCYDFGFHSEQSEEPQEDCRQRNDFIHLIC